jgi:RimJ/RimL family protein N-acetyltransferase
VQNNQIFYNAKNFIDAEYQMIREKLFLNYSGYFEKWLNMPAMDVCQAKGIVISSSTQRIQKPNGWRLYLPLCAFETEGALLISCIPKWEDELKAALENKTVNDAINVVKKFSTRKALAFSRHKFFGLDTLNTEIDVTTASPLDESHLDAYMVYYRKMHPRLAQHINPEVWVPKAFKDMVKQKVNYCIFAKDEIACVTESEDLPHTPESLIHIGINTLPEHRRKGYASVVCAAFIKHHLKQGKLPVWSCELHNQASEQLAIKLGLRYLGNEIFTSALTEI